MRALFSQYSHSKLDLNRIFSSEKLLLHHWLLLRMVTKIKKIYGIILIAAMLTMTTLCVSVVNAATGNAVSPGPAPDSGDGVPSGNQYIQPETPGDGPAPNSGDGVPDGSGF